MTRPTDDATPLLQPPRDVAAEIDVDETLLARLLQAQHADLAQERIQRFAEGWDNILFRVGTRWLARLPRRASAAPLVDSELRFLPQLRHGLPLEIPEPVREGHPGAGYPWRWSISRWIEGVQAAGAALDPDATADTLATFLRALHALEAPTDAPTNPYRDCPPRGRSESVLERIDQLGDAIEGPRIRDAWLAGCETPDWSGARVWCHGDLHPFNMLARGDQLVAALDWGDMHAGEPAPDLASVWMLLPPSHHDRFRGGYGDIEPETWRRAQTWALFFGVMFVSAGHEGAGEAATQLGRRTLTRALD